LSRVARSRVREREQLHSIKAQMRKKPVRFMGRAVRREVVASPLLHDDHRLFLGRGVVPDEGADDLVNVGILGGISELYAHRTHHEPKRFLLSPGERLCGEERKAPCFSRHSERRRDAPVECRHREVC
jgi:hypothetical protein